MDTLPQPMLIHIDNDVSLNEKLEVVATMWCKSLRGSRAISLLLPPPPGVGQTTGMVKPAAAE